MEFYRGYYRGESARAIVEAQIQRCQDRHVALLPLVAEECVSQETMCPDMVESSAYSGCLPDTAEYGSIIQRH